VYVHATILLLVFASYFNCSRRSERARACAEIENILGLLGFCRKCPTLGYRRASEQKTVSSTRYVQRTSAALPTHPIAPILRERSRSNVYIGRKLSSKRELGLENEKTNYNFPGNHYTAISSLFDDIIGLLYRCVFRVYIYIYICIYVYKRKNTRSPRRLRLLFLVFFPNRFFDNSIRASINIYIYRTDLFARLIVPRTRDDAA